MLLISQLTGKGDVMTVCQWSTPDWALGSLDSADIAVDWEGNAFTPKLSDLPVPSTSAVGSCDSCFAKQMMNLNEQSLHCHTCDPSSLSSSITYLMINAATAQPGLHEI